MNDENNWPFWFSLFKYEVLSKAPWLVWFCGSENLFSIIETLWKLYKSLSGASNKDMIMFWNKD